MFFRRRINTVNDGMEVTFGGRPFQALDIVVSASLLL